MTIRYDAELNNELRRVVKNFNEKRNRAIKRGFSYLPDKIYVSDIKKSFATRSELRKYIKEIEKFNKLKDYALETVTTAGGGKISRYNLMFLEQNLKSTKEFYDRQIEEAKEIYYEDQFSIARRDYLFNLQEKRKYLDLDIMNLNQSGLRTFERYTKQALFQGKSNIGSYKGFLSGVEQLMRNAGYSEKQISSFYDQMSNVTPAQFIRAYRENDAIGKIFDIMGSPKSGPSPIKTDDEEVKMILDKFMADFTKYIAKTL